MKIDISGRAMKCPYILFVEVRVGVSICEEICMQAGPVTLQAYKGAEVIVNIRPLLFHGGKGNLRERC